MTTNADGSAEVTLKLTGQPIEKLRPEQLQDVHALDRVAERRGNGVSFGHLASGSPARPAAIERWAMAAT
ncbi:MAG TPA: hypothetical protein VGJ77_15770 [Gaiellaceae bacterium]